MKYALNINNIRKDIALEADVWILDIPNRTTLKEMCDKYKIDKLVKNAKELIIRNVRYEDADDILKIQSWGNSNVYFAAPTLKDLELLTCEEIPNLFYALPVTNKSTYDYLCNYLKVPKVIVGGELGFSLGSLEHQEGTEILVNPAHIYGEIGDSTSFFIRPEDIDLYEGIINTLYFTSKSRSYEEVLFDVYKHRKKWYGNLQEIVINLDEPFYNHYLFKTSLNFGEARLNCRKKCMYNRAKCCFCDYQAILQHLIKKEEDKLKGDKTNG